MTTLRACLEGAVLSCWSAPDEASEYLKKALKIIDDAEILGREDRPDSWCVLIPDPKVDE